MTSIEDLLRGRAAAMAAHDGAPAISPVHLHGAANQLHAELLSARDRLATAPKPQPEAVRPSAPAKPATAAPTPTIAAKTASEKIAAEGPEDGVE